MGMPRDPLDLDESAEQEDKVDRKAQFRDRYKNTPLNELIRAMHGVRQVKDEYDDALKNINAHYDVLRIELIPAKMEEEGIERIAIEGIGRVSLTADMYVGVTDKTGLFDWLRKHKLGSLIKEQVPSATLKAFVKNRIIKGAPVPTELVKVTPFTRASITKA